MTLDLLAQPGTYVSLGKGAYLLRDGVLSRHRTLEHAAAEEVCARCPPLRVRVGSRTDRIRSAQSNQKVSE
jgi:hypothetical protein